MTETEMILDADAFARQRGKKWQGICRLSLNDRQLTEIKVEGLFDSEEEARGAAREIARQHANRGLGYFGAPELFPAVRLAGDRVAKKTAPKGKTRFTLQPRVLERDGKFFAVVTMDASNNDDDPIDYVYDNFSTKEQAFTSAQENAKKMYDALFQEAKDRQQNPVNPFKPA